MSPFPSSWTTCVALLLLSTVALVSAQNISPTQQQGSSWPQVYPGMPNTPYGIEWQHYFEVTESLPNVSWPLPRNWAGNIPVQRPGHPNNTLFFWGFESSNGSFTANSSEPWAIWLNGGPGGSSIAGAMIENGPIHILSNYSLAKNEYAWNNIVDHVWLDQPCGVGYSTVDADGYVADEEQVAADFFAFLENFLKVFPNLATRPLHINGESYAGYYISYIAKAHFAMENPPVKLVGVAVGDGAFGSIETFFGYPVTSVLETYPQIIKYDPEVFEYFREQSALCGYNITLQYPQPGHFPSFNAPLPFSTSGSSASAKLTKRHIMQETTKRFMARFGGQGGSSSDKGERLRARDMWRRDLSGRANGTIDPYYLCDLYDEMLDYAANFTFPWSAGGKFNVYDIPDALNPEAAADPSIFFNDPRTRSALHAPTSKNWVEVIAAPFLPTNSTTNVYGDPSIEPMAFLTDLATNATARNVSIMLYSGNDDSVVPHLSTEMIIQNTTFGNIQGFTRKPKTPWYNSDGTFGGIVHQERGWKFVLADHAGHLLAYSNPLSAFTIAREFIFGNNQTGLVTTDTDGSVSVDGGETPSLSGEIMTGQQGIYYGKGTTASTYFFPTATVSAWNAYIASATATTGTQPTKRRT